MTYFLVFFIWKSHRKNAWGVTVSALLMQGMILTKQTVENGHCERHKYVYGSISCLYTVWSNRI